MRRKFPLNFPFLFLFFLGVTVFFPLSLWTATTPTMILEEAKFAIDQARKAGGDRVALEDFVAAKSWLTH